MTAVVEGEGTCSWVGLERSRSRSRSRSWSTSRLRSVKGEVVGDVETVPLSVLFEFVFVVVVVWICRDGVREYVGSAECVVDVWVVVMVFN